MGGGSWTSADWGSYSSTTAGKSTSAIFTKRKIFEDFDPKNIVVRESCDSPDHPLSTPIIVAFDVTGSMSEIPAEMVKTGLPTLIEQTLTHKPVSDPQFCMLAVGDSYVDQAPLQATQFESDIRIAKQLQDIYLEGGGGGNRGESYSLAWYFAAKKTKTDSLLKRGKKGIMFTIGDEPMLPKIEAEHIKDIFGDHVNEAVKSTDLLALAEKNFDLYHVICTHGRTSSYAALIKEWQGIMGEERVVVLANHEHLPEVLASILRVHGGEPAADVAASWSGGTALVVADALKSMTTASRPKAGGAPAVWRPQPKA